MTPHTVVITDDAKQDLKEIRAYIARNDSPVKARGVILSIRDVIARLATFPQRGEHPAELLEVGVQAYRQVHFKPYRAIYEVDADTVYVLLVAEGRRDMSTLLQRWLLSGT